MTRHLTNRRPFTHGIVVLAGAGLVMLACAPAEEDSKSQKGAVGEAIDGGGKGKATGSSKSSGKTKTSSGDDDDDDDGNGGGGDDDGNGGGGDDDGNGGGGDGNGNENGGGGDGNENGGGGDNSANTCANTRKNLAGCQTCCDPTGDALEAWDRAFSACMCKGACKTACAGQFYCDPNETNVTSACDSCFSDETKGASCAKQADAACEADPTCAAVVACSNACDAKFP